MKVVPVTIGALAPTKETLASLTWREPARPEACRAPSMMCHRKVRRIVIDYLYDFGDCWERRVAWR